MEKRARDSPEEAMWDNLRNLKEWHERHGNKGDDRLIAASLPRIIH